MNLPGCQEHSDIELLTAQGKDCIKRYTSRAMKATFLPFVSLPLVHGLSAAMLAELSKIFGVSTAKNERLMGIGLGILATPFMLVPIWGAIAARSYIETVGNSYLRELCADIGSEL